MPRGTPHGRYGQRGGVTNTTRTRVRFFGVGIGCGAGVRDLRPKCVTVTVAPQMRHTFIFNCSKKKTPNHCGNSRLRRLGLTLTLPSFPAMLSDFMCAED